MKNCKKCDTEFKPTKGFINYCSIKCRNGRDWSEDDKIKKRDTMLKSKDFEIGLIKRKLNELSKNGELDESSLLHIIENKKKIRKKEILGLDFSELKYDRLRERIFYEQDEKCHKCGLSDWLGEAISLELEHKDGDNKNNSRENLEMLCPNCHSQTKTWRGRNNGDSKKKKVPDELLISALIKHDWNRHRALLSLDLAPKGNNYKRCDIIKEAYDNQTR